jgi:hypothetical protein
MVRPRRLRVVASQRSDMKYREKCASEDDTCIPDQHGIDGDLGIGGQVENNISLPAKIGKTMSEPWSRT